MLSTSYRRQKIRKRKAIRREYREWQKMIDANKAEIERLEREDILWQQDRAVRWEELLQTEIEVPKKSWWRRIFAPEAP